MSDEKQPLPITIDGVEARGYVLRANDQSGIVTLSLEKGDGFEAIAERALNTPPPKPRLVDDDGVAESPLPSFPGRIVFPAFNGGTYKAITQALGKKDGDWKEDTFELQPYWRVVQAIAQVELEGVDDGAPFDDVDGRVLAWAHDAATEYIDRFLTYGR
ncbi:MAG: hypothetical protein ACOC8X_03575 [Chloroflexota bacterium]